MNPSSPPILDINVACPHDFPDVMDILSEAAAWLKTRGIDQWPSPPNEHWHRRMAKAIERGEVYMTSQDLKHAGILRLTWSDPYWPDDDLAGYIHSMAIRNGFHGRGLGRAMLNWAVEQCRDHGRELLRLDCLASNDRLRRYYEKQGFNKRGQVVDRDYTAALYEKAI